MTSGVPLADETTTTSAGSTPPPAYLAPDSTSGFTKSEHRFSGVEKADGGREAAVVTLAAGEIAVSPKAREF
jgi:hypothetical protein